MKLTNKKIYYDFEVLETWIAGVVLTGTEIKSIRAGELNFTDSYAYITENEEVFVTGINIPVYSQGSYNNHDPNRQRKLLLKKKEIRKINVLLIKGISLKVISCFINNRGLFKMELGVCKGKKNYDKRNSIKAKDIERESQRE